MVIERRTKSMLQVEDCSLWTDDDNTLAGNSISWKICFNSNLLLYNVNKAK